MEIDTKKLNREEKNTGSIEFITRFMKKTVPVEITFRPPFLERLPVWILSILMWTIPVISFRLCFLISEISIGIFYAYIFKLIVYSCLIFISSKFDSGIYSGLSLKQKKIIAIPLMLTIIFPIMYITYFFYHYIGWFIFLIILNTLLVSEIYEKFSARQKEKTKAPLMIALLVPTCLVITRYCFYKINIHPIITVFFINIFIILFYRSSKKVGHIFNSWYKKREKGQ